jgi:hypothetical protein
VAVRVQQNVVRLDISVHNALLVDVAHGTPKLGHPEPHGLLCERLSRDVESQVAAVHEIDHNISAPCQPGAGAVSSSRHVQVFDVLEAVTQIAEERVVEVLEHPPLSNDISDAF